VTEYNVTGANPEPSPPYPASDTGGFPVPETAVPTFSECQDGFIEEWHHEVLVRRWPCMRCEGAGCDEPAGGPL
jgi:hypothetical protein